jgi:hypothetical protein
LHKSIEILFVAISIINFFGFVVSFGIKTIEKNLTTELHREKNRDTQRINIRLQLSLSPARLRHSGVGKAYL